jgi:hypothetical protein
MIDLMEVYVHYHGINGSIRVMDSKTQIEQNTI